MNHSSIKKATILDAKAFHSVFPVSIYLIGGLCAVLSMMALSSEIVDMVLVGLCAWALTGVKQSIKALSLAIIIKYLNPGIYVIDADVGILFWLVVLASAIRVLATVSVKHLRYLVPLLFFSFTVFFLSVSSSKEPDISILKTVSFTIIVGTIIIGTSSASNVTTREWIVWFFSLGCAIVLLSVITFLDPSIAYQLNGAGFQGIFNHPQSFGVWLAPLTVWVLMSLFLKKQGQMENLMMAIFALCLVGLIFSSQARTAMVAVILAVVSVFAVVVLNRRKGRSFSLVKVLLISSVSVTIIVSTMMFTDVLRKEIKSYVFKRDSANVEEALSSRSGGIKSQWKNFLENPIAGNGFGVYADGVGENGVVRVYGIPISAPVEKGFLPTAILEETGVIGTAIFTWFLIALFNAVRSGKDPRWMGMFFSCIFVNIGECVLLYPSGIGMYYWLLIGLSIVASKYSKQEKLNQ